MVHKSNLRRECQNDGKESIEYMWLFIRVNITATYKEPPFTVELHPEGSLIYFFHFVKITSNVVEVREKLLQYDWTTFRLKSNSIA